MSQNVNVSILQDGVWWMTTRAQHVKYSYRTPGGCDEASFTLVDGPLLRDDALRRGLRSGAHVLITSCATGEVMWQGTVSNPGRRTDNDGRLVCEVTCDGVLYDIATSFKRRPYIVTSLSHWERDDMHPSLQAAKIGSTTTDTGSAWEALVLEIPEGSTVTTATARARARTRAYDDTDYRIGTVRIRHLEGKSSSTWQTGALLGLDFGGNRLYLADMSAARSGDAVWGMDGSASRPYDTTLFTVFLQAKTSMTDPKVPDNIWSGFSELETVAQLFDRNGGRQTNGSMTLLAHQVIEDLVWRDLRGIIDPDSNTTIITQAAPYLLDTLDYSTDQVSPNKVLDDLVSICLDEYWWGVVPGAGNGQAGLLWQAWSDGHTYLLPATVTPDLRGSDEGLRNRVQVFYTDKRGRRKSVTRTANPNMYPATLDIGYWDEATDTWSRYLEAEPGELGDEIGSESAAGLIADGYLAQVATRPLGAEVAVTSPVMDQHLGRMLPPWELRPGNIARVAESGHTLRVTQTVYDDDAGACTLSLSTPRRSLDELIAKATRRRRRR